MKTRIIGLALLIFFFVLNVACGGGSTASNPTNGASVQTWVIDAGPDPVQQGREEEATITVNIPSVGSNTFTEVSPDPLGGMLMYSPDGSCHYQVVVQGNVANDGQSGSFMLSGSSGSGCGMSTVASGDLTTDAAFPNATSASGNITFNSQSPLGSASDSGTWNAFIQSGGSQIVMRKRAEEQIHHPKILFDLFRGFQPLDFVRQ